jgi:hypothetical protein
MSKREVRFFNTTGPCNPEDHYMLPPEERLIGAQLHRYIKDKLYWVLHAPRQTGKTTFLQSWMREINGDSSCHDDSRHDSSRHGVEAIACYVSIEDCQGVTDVDAAMLTVYQAIRNFAVSFRIPVPELENKDGKSLLQTVLMRWAEIVAPRPLIVLFDEVDVLQGEPLISFLRQLRGGFATRGPGIFPISIALVGMRDLKDYITAAKGGVPVNPGSPFNIKSDSASFANFQKDDVSRLFAQRTIETGQQITAEALDYVYEQSRGQPWIVNSLFERATMRVLKENSAETVTIEHIRQAREQMIEARETHLDALAYRLEDPAIHTVMESLITGEPDTRLANGEPFRLCRDLGLVDIQDGSPIIANPMYREVLAREITFSTQMALPKPDWKWANPDGTLDMDALLHNFQEFWRNNSEIWEEMSDFTEAFPHLLLMAFLQRVTNGDGRIEREYAAGRGRMDLAVYYKGAWNIIEIKLLRKNKTFTGVKAEGIRQVLQYRQRIDPEAPAYLVIFNRRPEKPDWAERLTWDQADGVTVVGC